MDSKIREMIRAKLGLAYAGKAVLAGMAALLVMVAVFAGRYAIDAATASQIVIDHPSDSSASESVAGPRSPEASDAASLFVHVSGAVNKPGLVELPAGARVAQAIDEAGGFAKEADESSVNLARRLEDGEQLFVSQLGSARDAPVADVPARATTPDAATGQLVNINTADSSQLETLPGIGPATAQKIVDDRVANGPFASTEDLKRVTGIGDKKYESLADMICI